MISIQVTDYELRNRPTTNGSKEIHLRDCVFFPSKFTSDYCSSNCHTNVQVLSPTNVRRFFLNLRFSNLKQNLFKCIWGRPKTYIYLTITGPCMTFLTYYYFFIYLFLSLFYFFCRAQIILRNFHIHFWLARLRKTCRRRICFALKCLENECFRQ